MTYVEMSMSAHTMQRLMLMKMISVEMLMTCPYDAENDADQDDICGDVDECPYDAEE